MAPRAVGAASPGPPGPRWPWLFDAMLRSYSQILLSRSPAVGVLLFAATALHPTVAMHGLGAALLANLIARGLSLDESLLREGLYGYNAMLVGLGVGATWQPGPQTLLLLAVTIVATVALTAAIHALLGRVFALPALTLPFVIAFQALLGLGAEAKLPWQAQLPGGWLDGMLGRSGPLVEIGALFFLPDPAVGALVVLACALASRIGTLLALLGWAVALGLEALVGPSPHAALAYNLPLVAYALGGVWFVPSLGSFVFAAGAALVAGFLALGLSPVLARMGMPMLILPFNATVLLLLYAMRQRTRDARPKSVDFALGTPEANLAYFQSRLERFGATTTIRLSAPFLGRWVCTQGIDGDESHQGPWRHAFDFEVRGADGGLHRGDGRSLAQYHCYGLPILAPADGTVVKVLDGVPDNKPGKLNLDDNWGNLVILQHGYGLFSKLCHLQPGSILVAEGQFLRRGDPLGKCGNSGRAARPHVHMQLQYTMRVGAPTAPLELHDLVHECDEGPRLRARSRPRPDDIVRNIEPTEDLGRHISFPYGQTLELRDSAGRVERVTADIDAWGRLLLRSDRGDGVLIYERTDEMLTVYDTIAPRASVLHVLHAALSRVALDGDPDLRWEDRVELRAHSSLLLRPLADLVSPFRPRRGERVTLRLSRNGDEVCIPGESDRLDSEGRPRLRTEARFDAEGFRAASLVVDGRRTVVERLPSQRSPSPGAPP